MTHNENQQLLSEEQKLKQEIAELKQSLNEFLLTSNREQEELEKNKREQIQHKQNMK